jgi:iduronate 2-sulfatase
MTGSMDTFSGLPCRLFRHLLACLLLGVAGSVAAAERPNVLLLCVDDLRPELNCFGEDYIHSPNIDALAASGRGFARHYVQAPTCGASRYALLTGRYGAPSNGALFARARRLARDADAVPPSMPAWFRQHGYRTVSVGKVSHHPGGRGGPDWDDASQPEMPQSWDRHLMPVGPWQHPRGAMHGLARGEIRGQAKDMDVFQSVPGDDSIYPDGLTTETALEQLDALSAESQPFFLAVGIIRPHLPFGAPAKYMRHYDGVTLPPIDHPQKPAGRTTWHRSGEFMKYNRWGRNPNQDAAFATEVRRHYAACVSYADAQVGRVLEGLRRSGQADNTIVVLWGDHGWNLGEHAIWGKHCLFEESLRSPLIIRHPGLTRPGAISDAIVETVDVFPTLCELAGLPQPQFVHGQSLAAALEEPRTGGRPALSYWRGAKTIRTPTHRMILHDDGFVELYDHRQPDAETKNLAVADKPPRALIERLTVLIEERLQPERADPDEASVATPTEAETKSAASQEDKQPRRASPTKSRRRKPFRWVNAMPAQHAESLRHATIKSDLVGQEVGYMILLPEDYERSQRRYPVVYYLHGGRPGDETRSVRLADRMVRLRKQHDLQPLIYVFVNGGPVSHYNVPDRIGVPGEPDARGADVFIRELIPHVDATYRTLAHRRARGLEGFSQGGRGTMRLSLRYPERFSSVAAGGGGYATEKRISKSPDSAESPQLRFAAGDNTWDLARGYARREKPPPLKLMIYVGTKGFNYENNLDYMDFLKQLGIPHRRLVVPGVPHSVVKIYDKQGLEIMRFHEANLAHD